jgi:hypothetical protein
MSNDRPPLTAAHLHEATIRLDVLEGELFELLIRLRDGLPGEIDEFTTDYYDNSIEIYGVAPSDVVRDGMFAIGFDSVWQHPHPAPRGECKCPRQSRPRC